MRAIECPNCGAPATNHQNCEFCGSLLVRFADKDIDLSRTSYLSNDAVIPGLINQLEKNLSLQESGKFAGTDLYIDDSQWASGKNNFCFVCGADHICFQDDQHAFPNAIEGETSLASCFTFLVYNDNTISPLERERHNRFKALPSFPLFTPHFSSGNHNGYDYIYYEYAIDFGKDAEGTARLISEISNKVFGVDIDNPTIDCYTGEYEEILKHRKALFGTSEEDGIETSEEDGINWKKWIWIGISIIGGLIYLLS